MAVYGYEIGTVAGGAEAMTNVEELVPALGRRCVPPEGLAVEAFSVYRTGADGQQYGDGFPRTSWRFKAITQSQLDALLTYIGAGNQSASVLITTRGDGRTYTTYEAVVHRPIAGQDMQPAYGSMWHDVTIRFTMLEAV